MKRSVLLFVLIGLTQVLYALQLPMPLTKDSHIQVIAYSNTQVTLIKGQVLTTTQIVFGAHEMIQSVENGDSAAWSSSIDPHHPNVLFIKPTVYDSNTNMTITTNQHTYYFKLTSNRKGQVVQQAPFAIRFIYPAMQQKQLSLQAQQRAQQHQAELSAFLHPNHFNWQYSYNGSQSIVPIHVFDDQKFTYFQLQPHQAIPAVFAVTSASGKESVVNARVDGQYMVINRVSPQFTLRVGHDQVCSIFNNKLISHLDRRQA